METEDFVTCPLCHGSAQMRRSELLGLLRVEDLRGKLEGDIDPLTAAAEAVQTVPEASGGEFAEKVHHWNAKLTLWRRSAKE